MHTYTVILKHSHETGFYPEARADFACFGAETLDFCVIEDEGDPELVAQFRATEVIGYFAEIPKIEFKEVK